MMPATAFKHELACYKTAWLRQLKKVYAHLLWSRGVKAAPASLALTDSETVWGRWLERERRILISARLIFEHPWPAVLGVLGHETAHQLVSDHGGCPAGETAHGSAFKTQAQRLNLDPFYMSPTVDLSNECPQPWPVEEKSADRLDPKSASILNKVRKLLALSASPVLAEAQAAMKAASRLMARHNFEVLEDPAAYGKGYCRVVIPLKRSRIQRRSALIANILNRHFFVETIFVPGYNSLTDVEEKNLELLGRPENTQLAEHVFYFLMERTESLWQEYRKTHPGGGQAARNSFMVGLIEAFADKLPSAEKMFENQMGVSSALVLAKDSGLKAFMKNHHPKIRFSRLASQNFCPESGLAGQAAGRSLNLNRPVNHEPATSAKMAGLIEAGGKL